MTQQASPVATPPPATPPPPPPPTTPPLSTLTEKASQLAGTISNQTQFEAALATVPGGTALPAPVKGQLWDTVNKTRVGQGLPPLQIAGPAGAQPVVGGQTPVPPAVNAALPASVTGAQPAAPPPGGAPPPAPGLKQVPGQEVPLEQAPPPPTAKYEAPKLLTADYKAPDYKPPNKGLEYAAMALALLFPGAPIGRAAAGFAQGLNTGAKDKYARDVDTAKTQYEANKAKDEVINQGALAQAAANFTAAQREDAYIATKTGVDNANQDRIYNARQLARTQGTDPNTGKPFVLPQKLVQPPSPKMGYDGLAQWHNARAAYYESVGATGPAAQEVAAGKEATTQADNAANNARELGVAAARLQQQLVLHNDTEWHEDQRALLTDSRERANFGVKATDADKSLFTTWTKYTTPQQKQVEVKDVNGNVVGVRNAPLLDDKGNPVPPPINDSDARPGKPGFQTRLTQIVNLVRKDKDPAGAAAYYAGHMGSDPAGLAAQEILQQAGQASSLRMMANGRMPEPHDFPKYTAPQPVDPIISQAVGVLKSMSPAEQSSTIDGATTYSATEKAQIRKQLGLKPEAESPPQPPAPARLSRADRTVAAQAHIPTIRNPRFQQPAQPAPSP